MGTEQFDGGADAFFAKYERFNQLAAQLVEKTAEKFNVPDPDVVAPELSGDPAGDELDGVRVEMHPEMGNVLVAARRFNRGDIVLKEAPVVVAHATAFNSAARLRELAAHLPAGFDLSSYEAHISSAQASIRELVDDDEALLRLFMVFRVNAMQWGPQHSAILRVSSKASHSCNPNVAFTRDEDGSAFRVTVHCIYPLSEGDVVTFSYLDDPDDLLCPASIRQIQLQSHKYFVCHCSRCLSALNGDPCRGFPCPCGRVVLARNAGPDSGDRRYPASEADFKCQCGRDGVEQRLLEVEMNASAHLEDLLHTLGGLTTLHIIVQLELSGDSDVLRKIDALYELARSLGSAHWLACRASMLKWRGSLAHAKVHNCEVSDCSLLVESIDFVKTHCAELLPYVAIDWVAQSARFLNRLHWSNALSIYSIFVSLTAEGNLGVLFCDEEWLVLFKDRGKIRLCTLD